MANGKKFKEIDMKKRNKISITICSRVFHRSLVTAIRGYVGQSVSPWEVIVVGELKMIDRLRQEFGKNKLVKLYKFSGEKNEARNFAISKARGDYIIFSDHDMIPSQNLIENCLKFLPQYDALIIQEKGKWSGRLRDKLLYIEKKIVETDIDAQTPRLFKRNIFGKSEKMFESKYGVLDEWGFGINLEKKKPNIKLLANSYFEVHEEITLLERLKKNYDKGRYSYFLLKVAKMKGARRVNPVKRGLYVYCNNLPFIKKYHIYFAIFILAKILDFTMFLFGFTVTSLKTLKLSL